MTETKEYQNQPQIDEYNEKGGVTFGPWTSHIMRSDPRHLSFLFSRYKFIAKMLEGRNSVMEVGCGDGAGLPIILQTVKHVHALDIEPLVLNDAKARYKKEGIANVTFIEHDICSAPLNVEKLDAAYSLDVIEHIPASEEQKFMKNIVSSLNEHAVLIVGTPNITSSPYASEASEAGHINLKSRDTLHDLMSNYFHNVFDFSMNDEVVHTGFGPMAHYIFSIGVGVKL